MVILRLMGCGTRTRARLDHWFLGKGIERKLLFELEKWKSKKQKSYQKLPD